MYRKNIFWQLELEQFHLKDLDSRFIMAYFLDPLEMESDAEDDESTDDLAISKNTAKALYDGAGEFVEEDSGDITLYKYQHLLNDRVALMIEAVLTEHPLPFKLQDFRQ